MLARSWRKEDEVEEYIPPMVKVESTEIDDDGVIAFGRTQASDGNSVGHTRNGIKL